MDSKQTTTNPSPEQKAQAEKLTRDIQTIVTFIVGFIFMAVLVWGLYSMAAPFWHLPGASFWEVGGTMGMGYLLLLGVKTVIDMFR